MATFTYTNTTGATNIDGLVINQSTNVYGTTGTITGVSVGFNDLVHDFISDLDVLLVAPDGVSNLEFLSDAGGSSNFDGDYVFADGGTDIAEGIDVGTLLEGIYAPSAFISSEDDAYYGTTTGGINSANNASSTNFVDAFGGLGANGAWNLYFGDDFGLDPGSFTSWDLTIETNTSIGQIDGTAADDTITVTSTSPTQGSWNFNGNIVSYTGVNGFILNGGAGNDIINGGIGDDVINGGSSTTGDNLFGGGNTTVGDTLSYAGSAGGVSINLSSNTASGGDAENDIISGFENVTGSDHNDELFGRANSKNTLSGGGGMDFLVGFGGTNTLLGGANDDTLGIQIGLVETGSTFDGGADNDTLLIAGPSGSENFTNDTITSIETLRFSDEPANFEVIFNADQFNFTEVITGAHAGFDRNIQINLGNIGNFDLSGVAFTGFEPGNHITINGNATAETIVGSSLADTIRGGNGTDNLDGGAGDDIIEGGAGADILVGGANATIGDTVSYEGSFLGVRVSLISNTAENNTGVTGSHAEGDTITGFENVTGSQGDDLLLGNFGANILHGSGGNDFINGFGGQDQLFGGSGNDTFSFASIDDITPGIVMNGGLNFDTLELVSVGTLSVDLTNDTITEIEKLIFAINSNGILETLTLSSSQFAQFEEIERESNATDVNINIMIDSEVLDLSKPTFTGFNDAQDALNVFGTLANETVIGSSRIETIETAGGNDTIFASLGFDTIDGGIGVDTFDLTNSTGVATNWVNLEVASAQFRVDSGAGFAGRATLTGIENVRDSSGNDRFFGDGDENTYYYSSGFDTVDGNGGFDTLDYSGLLRNFQWLDLQASSSQLRSNDGTGFVANARVEDVENFITTTQIDHFRGDAGDQTVQYRGGRDFINGREGSDRIDFSEYDDGNWVNLNIAFDQFRFFNGAGFQSGGNLQGVEGVIGGDGNDFFFADAEDNFYFGGLGNDRFEGGAGADTFEVDGMLADYTLAGSGSTFTLSGLSGTDTLIDVEQVQIGDTVYNINDLNALI